MLARAAAVGALALAIVLVAALVLTGGGGAEYKVRFQTAGQLVKGDDVQVGGRRVGSIDKIELTEDNHAVVTVTMQDDFAELHKGTVATIRATSLSGVANRYIALTLGPNSAPKLEEGATLRTDETTTIVDLDQIFNTLDAKARQDLRALIRGSATQYAGNEKQANRAARYFSPVLSTTQQLVNEILRDQGAFTGFLVDSSKLVTAVAERREDLSALVGNTNQTAGAIAAENQALDTSLSLLPGTLRRANTTFVNLRSTLDDLDVLVAESKPATRRLAPFLRELRPLVAAARPTVADLRRLVGTPGANNDLTDAVQKLPRLQRVASPTFRNSITALRKVQPVLQFIRPYTPELVGWLRDFGQGASNYDANGHFARIQPIFNAFSVNDANVLSPIPPANKFDGYQTRVFRRCPGAASQPAQDGSAPFTDSGRLDCDPSLVPPGP